MPASVPSKIRERLYEKLKDPAYASAYVNEALLEGDEVVFKTAVGDVIRARGVVKIARKAGINRSTVFKTLKPETRTSFTTFHQHKLHLSQALAVIMQLLLTTNGKLTH